MKNSTSFVQPTSISPSSSFYNTSPSLSPISPSSSFYNTSPSLSPISPSSSFYNTSPCLSPSRHNHNVTSMTLATSVSVRTLRNESDLIRRLKESSANEAVTVVKCHASYCAGCRGAAPKYNKLAAAYDGEHGRDRIAFYDLDYPANEEFCKEALGVANLPFFAVFKGTNLMSAQPIGWRSLSTTLVDNIEHAINNDDC